MQRRLLPSSVGSVKFFLPLVEVLASPLAGDGSFNDRRGQAQTLPRIDGWILLQTLGEN